jgi:hypothetical protein
MDRSRRRALQADDADDPGSKVEGPAAPGQAGQATPHARRAHPRGRLRSLS